MGWTNDSFKPCYSSFEQDRYRVGFYKKKKKNVIKEEHGHMNSIHQSLQGCEPAHNQLVFKSTENLKSVVEHKYDHWKFSAQAMCGFFFLLAFFSSMPSFHLICPTSIIKLVNWTWKKKTLEEHSNQDLLVQLRVGLKL